MFGSRVGLPAELRDIFYRAFIHAPLPPKLENPKFKLKIEA